MEQKQRSQPCPTTRRLRRRQILLPMIVLFLCYGFSIKTDHSYQAPESSSLKYSVMAFSTPFHSWRHDLSLQGHPSTHQTHQTTTMLSQESNPMQKRRHSFLEATRVNGDTSTISDDTQTTQYDNLSSGLLSPYHVLYPESFHNFTAPLDYSVPLWEALQLMKQSVEHMIQMEKDQEISFMTQKLLKAPIIRIEQRISHRVDPLCWLQAQMNRNAIPFLDPIYRQNNHPTFYFATGEQTLESAVYGSSHTYKGAIQNDHAWQNIISNLPNRARVYGGQRFDTESIPAKEWKSFSKGFWMVPAIELRRENPLSMQDMNIETTTTTNSSTTSSTYPSYSFTTTTLAVHLVADTIYDSNGNKEINSFENSARHVLSILQSLSDTCTPSTPPTTLPPVISRSSTYQYNQKELAKSLSKINSFSSQTETLDGQEVYEKGVAAALQEFANNRRNTVNNRTASGSVNGSSTNTSTTENLEKVVLARRIDLKFAQSEYANVRALDILRKWKFGNQPGGHLFYLCPDINGGFEFFGCTPERLFQVVNTKIDGNSNTFVVSEALAGTRPRGSTPENDDLLSRQLFASTKDQAENQITGKFIMQSFNEMQQRGWIQTSSASQRQHHQSSDVDEAENNVSGTIQGEYFVRRLRHLQHICQRFQCQLTPSVVSNATQFLIESLHPTPAVNGYPKGAAMDFIRKHETIGFDRGFYSGPIGFVGCEEAEIAVAIRSGLLSSGTQSNFETRSSTFDSVGNAVTGPKVSVYAGAGIVTGSTVQGEWAETSYKLAVVSSIFPQSPITLQSAQTPNSAWATAFVEELIRNGVTQFYICPGSRSTPLVAAIAKAVRSKVGVVHALSVHDERGAGFRAVGYARGAGRPAAVVTSSGTAVANLYPSIVEAGMDGIPMLVLTADRPYENRNTGANQAIDQVKVFSQSYVRWFRDVLPPHDDVPVSAALSDASQAVAISKSLMGPVHLNLQFRENLAPEGGPIRNDNRANSVTIFDSMRFTDAAGFQRWSVGGSQWMNILPGSPCIAPASVVDIVNLLRQSKRGMIVVGNIRKIAGFGQEGDVKKTMQTISKLAQTLGLPIFASVQSAALRFESPAVVLFAEHLLRHPTVQNNLQPDLILQFGAPLVSTEIPKIIKETLKKGPVSHVLVHQLYPQERADPEFTTSHVVNSDIDVFLEDLMGVLSTQQNIRFGSQLAPMVKLGRRLQHEMPRIVQQAAKAIGREGPDSGVISEPEIVMGLSNVLCSEGLPDQSLFLSNSMPVRDAEAFLYPLSTMQNRNCTRLIDTAVNRGASGIDGVIASAAGFADSTSRPTSLLIGDVAALHDINSLHALRTGMTAAEAQAQKIHPLTTIVLNNDGGGIFSFLPIAKYGSDVGFEDFFGTPTNTFSLEKGANAFDLPYQRVTKLHSFEDAHKQAILSRSPSVIEVVVASREHNVVVHQEISSRVNTFLTETIENDSLGEDDPEILPVKHLRTGAVDGSTSSELGRKILVLLHGWMGDMTEWKEVKAGLVDSLSSEWSIISLDLPGHGKSKLHRSSEHQSIAEALRLPSQSRSAMAQELSLNEIALAVCRTLKDYGVTAVDALAGYSLGGRVALAMKRLSMLPFDDKSAFDILSDETKMILLSTNPGVIVSRRSADIVETESENAERILKDERLAAEIESIANQGILSIDSPEVQRTLWSEFLHRWYDAPIWGSMRSDTRRYSDMIERRLNAVSRRSRDLAEVLRQCSPPRCSSEDWRGVTASKTLFIAGDLDLKYCSLGRKWYDVEPSLAYIEVPGKGHALLVEAAKEVARATTDFLLSDQKESSSSIQDESKIWDASFIPTIRKIDLQSEPRLVERRVMGSIGSLDFESFQVGLNRDEHTSGGLTGIGWGDRAEASQDSSSNHRSGFVIQLMAKDGVGVGIGEVSPLNYLHSETTDMAGDQLEEIAGKLSELDPDAVPSFDAISVLSLDGALGTYVDLLSSELGINSLLPSVRAGLEMAILSLAAQIARAPLHQALVSNSPHPYKISATVSTLPLNGLIRRRISLQQYFSEPSSERPMFSSWKVKIGHQLPTEDVVSLQNALNILNEETDTKIRADANRYYNESSFLQLSQSLSLLDISLLDRIEYIEEPLEKVVDGTSWSLTGQIEALERCFDLTSIPYALDESVHDLLKFHNNDFEAVAGNLREVFGSRSRGCAAVILKPALLGLETSLRIARFVKSELGISAVFTSSFESGVGLAYTAFLGSISDISPSKGLAQPYPHGLSTYDVMASDTLAPAFGSYVSQKGVLNVASLSRALYGLALDEIQCLSSESLPPSLPALETSIFFSNTTEEQSIMKRDSSITNKKSFASPAIEDTFEEFEASTSTSSSGRDIVLVASLPLPFSSDVASARFTDLPQQPRWSPWLASVAYLDAGSETEWTLRVRGVNFKWRAKSELLTSPYKGIRWQSTSGVKNTGIVEFIPSSEGDTSTGTCTIRVRMAFVIPRLLSSLFRGTIVEDFLRNKIMKWSLEMFRDIVKGDLALEKGNIELGDALFGAVEGKASAIEATLASSSRNSLSSPGQTYEEQKEE